MIPIFPLILGLAFISLAVTLYWGRELKKETLRMRELTQQMKERIDLE